MFTDIYASIMQHTIMNDGSFKVSQIQIYFFWNFFAISVKFLVTKDSVKLHNFLLEWKAEKYFQKAISMLYA